MPRVERTWRGWRFGDSCCRSAALGFFSLPGRRSSSRLSLRRRNYQPRGGEISVTCSFMKHVMEHCGSSPTQESGRRANRSDTQGQMIVTPGHRNSLSVVRVARWVSSFVFLLVFSIPACGQVRVWEGVLKLPTYEEGAPDPNPPFDQFSTGRFNYPYTLRNEITNARTEHEWRAVYLENEYLKCSVLPDIGGHLYTCVDKISGQPMFYANPSIKKARIGYRGAWAAFGVEFNFPVSHNWVSMSPVNYALTPHPDGSASVTVGNVDRVYGMEWTVELTLRPGSTVLQQRVTLSNRSDVRHRFYWWNNAGVQVWDDSRIQYPQRFAAAHGFA